MPMEIPILHSIQNLVAMAAAMALVMRDYQHLKITVREEVTLGDILVHRLQASQVLVLMPLQLDHLLLISTTRLTWL